MFRSVAVAASLAAAVVALLLIGGAYWLRPKPPAAPPEPEIDYPVGDFTLTERSGKPVSRDDLRGKVWVASFVFTHCTGPCPLVTATMERLQGELASYGDEVKLVTFTVDPEHDDAQKLCCYARDHNADPDRWLFLTGKEEDVYRLLRKGFRLPAEKTGSADPGQAVDHSPRLAVVDRRGHVRGYYWGISLPTDADPAKEFEDNLEKLKQKVAELVREAPE
jgi:cytochrome oxidase Cu insertion factor (SCO1/SenC/PrrC family)